MYVWVSLGAIIVVSLWALALALCKVAARSDATLLDKFYKNDGRKDEEE